MNSFTDAIVERQDRKKQNREMQRTDL